MKYKLTRKEMIGDMLYCAELEPKIGEIVYPFKTKVRKMNKAELLVIYFSLLSFLEKNDNSLTIFKHNFIEQVSICNARIAEYDKEYCKRPEVKAK